MNKEGLDYYDRLINAILRKGSSRHFNVNILSNHVYFIRQVGHQIKRPMSLDFQGRLFAIKEDGVVIKNNLLNNNYILAIAIKLFIR